MKHDSDELDAKVAALPDPRLVRTRRPVSREARELLLIALRRGFDVVAACRIADMPTSTAYSLRHANPEFGRDFDLARAAGLLSRAERRFRADTGNQPDGRS